MAEPTNEFMTQFGKDFPYQTKLSFAALIKYWEKRFENAEANNDVLALEVQKQLKNTPELKKPIENLSLIGRHKQTIDLMMSAIFADAVRNTTLMSAHIPFSITTFYSTPGFDRLITQSNKMGTDFDTGGMLKNTMVLSAGLIILKKIYKVKTDVSLPYIIHIKDADTGLDHYFNLQINPGFCEVVALKKPKKLSPETINHLFNDIYNTQLWLEHLPPDTFEIHGFGIFTLTEVTDHEIISSLKFDLLKQDGLNAVASVERLQQLLRSLFKVPELKLGYAEFDLFSDSLHFNCANMFSSLVSMNDDKNTCLMCSGSVYEKAIKARKVVIIDDLEKLEKRSAVEEILLSKGIRNIVITPVYFENRPVGLLELGSPHPGVLNPLSTIRLKDLLPLLTVAVERSMEERRTRIRAIIKEKYTSIHPSVEWRFVKAAANHLDRQFNNEKSEIEPIIFENVYPLYGQSDIRGSSDARAAAIQQDLIEHLRLAKRALEEVYSVKPLAALDEILFRIKNDIRLISKGLTSGDELATLEFLRQEAEPLMKHFMSTSKPLSKAIGSYFSALDKQHGFLNRRRKEYEESVTAMNAAILAVLEQQQQIAQQLYPHYFERYLTDGVEYNIYIGESISPEHPFDTIYLRNLRLWQLITMCEITRSIQAMKSRLPLQLDITHLALIYSAPLSIRFRMDEKQFDVEGAYNIRYQIVKKRIDKAVSRHTGERITQPGKIAVIFTQPREAAEYKRYMDYLRAKGFITGKTEELELEDLPGAHGLKALRVQVNLQPDKKAAESLEIMKMMKEGVN